MKLLELSILFVCIHVAVWEFKEGFLLTRTASTKTSSPDTLQTFIDTLHPPQIQELNPIPIQLPPRYKRIVIMLVDALRFDFLSGADSAVPHLTVVDMLRNNTQNHQHLLMHFIADPPTTTMQRLKALLSGSLPTFVEAGSNFASTKLSEDTWISQLKHSGAYPLAFMGDETWVQLVKEGTFDWEHASPSLDVFDLDSVDEACVRDMFPALCRMHELRSKGNERAQLLVSHFLGVDHCGHRHGPDHPEMRRKMNDVDVVIRRLLFDDMECYYSQNYMDEDTLFMVFGDHGMDSKGDHGGASQIEVDAGILFYTRNSQPRFPCTEAKHIWESLELELSNAGVGQSTPWSAQDSFPAVTQIDLTPTLSLLTGIPIPYGNLGMLIPQLCLCANSLIKSEAADLGIDAMMNLLIQTRINAIQVVQYLSEYADDSLAASFSNNTIVLARLEIQVQSLWKQFADSAVDKDQWTKEAIEIYIQYAVMLRSSLEKCKDAWAKFDMKRMIVGCVVMALTVIVVFGYSLRSQRSLNLMCLFGIQIVVGIVNLLPVLQVGHLASVCIGALSAMISTLRFTLPSKKQVIAISIMLLHGGSFGSNSFVVFEDSVVHYLAQSILLYLLYIVSGTESASAQRNILTAMIFTRLSSIITVCREEQIPTCIPTFYSSLSPFFHSPDATTSHLSTQSLLVLNVFLLFTGCMMRSKFSRLMLGLFGLLMGAYWWLEFASEQSTISWREDLLVTRNWTARTSFLSSLIGLAYSLFRRRRTYALICLFCFLATVQLPTGLVAMCCGLISVVSLLRALHHTEIDIPGELVGLLLSLLSHHYFFTTGHQAAFSSIQFQTGFIGISEFWYEISGLLVVLNTIGPSIFFACVAFIMGKLRADNRYFIWFLVHRMMCTLVTMVSAMHLRRHLMVWKVFAPRFMLGGVDVSIASLVFFLMSWIDNISQRIRR